MSAGTAEDQAAESAAVIKPETVDVAVIEEQELATPTPAETQPNTADAAQAAHEVSQETSAVDMATDGATVKVEAAAEDVLPVASSPHHVEHTAFKDEPTEQSAIKDEPTEQPTIKDEPSEQTTIKEEPKEQPTVKDEPTEQLAIKDEPTDAHAAATDNDKDTDFVPPDMEHIVSTGAAQDGASSMQALRELVAQARASSGQPREALPPGFGDEEPEPETSTSTPAQAQRGEKRKAEDELESLVQSSAGIDEVKAAAEKSQHPETKTLLQKALSSISGLVSRRSKADTVAATTVSTSSDKNTAQDDVKPLVDAEVADASEDSDDSDDSSDSDSSSGDSSDGDDDDNDEDEASKAGPALAGEDFDDEEGAGDSTAPATKNEILAPDFEQPTIQQVTEAERQTLRKLGKVHSIVDSVVVVEQDVQQSKPAEGSPATASVPVDSTGRQGERQGEYSVLDTGSLLCFEDGKVLGLVFETFGSIHNPMYSIRFASATAIDRELTQKGKAVFYLPSQSTYVLTQLLRSMKGSDASNMWDEEVADDEIDYSDDEQEAEAKRRAKALRYGKVDDQGNPLPAPTARANKRQKQHGAGPNSQPQPSSNGYSLNQRPKHGGAAGAANAGYAAGQQHSQQRLPAANAPLSLPRRIVGGADLPLPPVPTGPASLAPAFPHGIASLPPKPLAGLPSKPNFAAEASMSSRRSSSEHTNDQQAALGSRSRTATADSGANGLTHSRMNSAAASGLPAKPVEAVAAAAAAAEGHASSGSTTPKQSTSATAMSPYRAPAGGVGASSSPPPPHASRQALMRGVAPTPAAAYPHQGSPGWYAGAGSASSSTPASPAAPRGVTYGSAAGAPVAAQGGGHYNPAYAAHWQQQQQQQHASFGPAATSAHPSHPAAGQHAWNAPYQHHPAPLHMTPGAISHQQPYGGYGGYGAPAGAASGAPWAGGQTYPGSHYPGYTDRQYHASAANAHAAHAASHNHYAAPPTQAQGYGSYSTQGSGGDLYNGYVYAPPSAQAASASNAAASSAAQDSYDPRSPLMSGNSGQSQHGASGSSQGR